jgi:hypothetical protein
MLRSSFRKGEKVLVDAKEGQIEVKIENKIG